MKAVVMRDHGGPEVLEVREVERPNPNPVEVRIRTVAAGVNPVDWQVREGSWVPDVMGEPPMILGWEVAGTVEEAGDSVFRFAPGDRVFGMPWFPHPARCHAEYVTAPFRHIAHTPEALTDEQAGALPLAGLTAWQALVEVAGVGEGDRVLVHAAAGGVGHLAVQIAKAHGAYVIGTARADNHDFLRELGVDEPIDYTAGPFEEAVSDVDVVLDLVGEDDPSLIRSVEVLRKGGVLVAIAGELSKNVIRMVGMQSKRATEILVAPDDAGLESLAALADEGTLTVHLERTFPLEHASEAHELLREGRVRGKLVLTT
ncbi:MAG TPA: NADP-dependent oxidoreductase [Solirubrobacterales bacterium]